MSDIPRLPRWATSRSRASLDDDGNGAHAERLFQQSEEQHRKSRTLVTIAATDPQFTADLFDKRPNNPHSQSLAIGWIKTLRQTRAVIGNR
jgi:hypothetical protein